MPKEPNQNLKDFTLGPKRKEELETKNKNEKQNENKKTRNSSEPKCRRNRIRT